MPPTIAGIVRPQPVPVQLREIGERVLDVVEGLGPILMPGESRTVFQADPAGLFGPLSDSSWVSIFWISSE